ncbi:glycerol-3-phosphate dehydrogenase/oxidase [Nocardiopsis ganjiahuensis]|uniref:glycerol-3-phosphate dehydrogenase/oxidase n=1 Tax=Nocardiopsis ganjiahuensis TaxID=239984 RepID=UPI00034CEC02|nr:glycerol-3-phosphate dehydrogenase/oxidase [Nocardiopsis ganjiahuensis]
MRQHTRSTSLNAVQRATDLAELEARPEVDVLVVGGGVTGAGVALDAASRGLSTVLVEREDLAFGTSRWSSKLVHGGLRYLAKGQVGIAYESARERDVLMRVTAPHLVRPMPMVVPVHRDSGLARALLVRAGTGMGDLLRVLSRTPASVLPPPRILNARQTVRLLPGVRTEGLLGGVLSFDGQLVDDARLVLGIARTAAREGARIITRCSADSISPDGVVLRDENTGTIIPVRPRAVVNATGVHADALDPGIRLSPSRGTHLVLDGASLGHPKAALTVPLGDSVSRFVFALPQSDGRVFAGLTDEPVAGPAARVPEVPEEDVDFLLAQFNRALSTELTRADVIGSFAGLRPLLHGDGSSADLSREHSVSVAPNGAVTVVGGKLTTYRAMAEEAVDTLVDVHRLPAGPCRTRGIPLVGAASHEELDSLDAPRRLVARYGTEAVDVVAEAEGDPALLIPVARGITPAELRFGVRHEGALNVADLLERRSRIALVDADRQLAEAAAREALAAAE